MGVQRVGDHEGVEGWVIMRVGDHEGAEGG